jgi:type IV pilus assembly protein PilM
VAVEIAANRVTAVAMSDHGASRTITGYASEPLVDAAAPALNAVNVHDESALAGVLSAVLEKLGQRTRRIALVLPDSVAKISLLRFDKVPGKAQDLEQLIRWQVRKSAPFRIEDAQVAWEPSAALPDGGREYVVTVARRDIVRSYERACEAAGAHAGIIDIASFNKINALLARGPAAGDWLLVDLAPDYATLAVVRGDHVIFYRHRSAAGEADLADLVHQTTMYHEDRLGGGGFVRAVVSGASVVGVDALARLIRSVQERIGVPAEPIDFRPAAELRDRIGAQPELLDVLAAGAGILLRERAPRRAARGAAAEGAA